MTPAHGNRESSADRQAEMKTDPAAESGPRPIDGCATIFICLAGVILATQAVHVAEQRGGGMRLPVVRATLDANRSPWWEFTVLPRIGETMARRMVDYRMKSQNQSPGDGPIRVFRGAPDLDDVRGIGPKTILRIAPHLRFD